MNLADIRFGDADGDTLSLDESLALRTAASRLVGEFAGCSGRRRSSGSCIPRSTSSRR